MKQDIGRRRTISSSAPVSEFEPVESVDDVLSVEVAVSAEAESESQSVEEVDVHGSELVSVESSAAPHDAARKHAKHKAVNR